MLFQCSEFSGIDSLKGILTCHFYEDKISFFIAFLTQKMALLANFYFSSTLTYAKINLKHKKER